MGAVLGSAAIAVLIDSRLAAQGLGTGGSPEGGANGLPAQVFDPFSTAMSQALLLPVAVLVLGFIAVLFFEQMRHISHPGEAAAGHQGAEPVRRTRHAAVATDSSAV